MDLEIIRIKNGKTPTEEFVLLKVLRDTNLKEYIIGDNSYNSDGDLSNKHPHTYRFPDKKVKKDERVFLYTKPGTYKFGESSLNNPAHFFYWGLKTCVWNNNGKDTAHLLKIVITKNVPVEQ